MVLILSEINDRSTFHIIQWLEPSNAKYHKLNKEDNISIQLIDLSKNKAIIKINEEILDLSDVRAVWYRIGFFNFDFSNLSEDDKVNHALREEAKSLNIFLMRLLLEKTISINDYFSSYNNKLITLIAAQKVGLKIPNTYLTSYSDTLQKQSDLVTKRVAAQLIKNNRNRFRKLTI